VLPVRGDPPRSDRSARYDAPLLLLERGIGDALQGKAHVPARRFGGDLSVGQEDLPGALEEAPRVLGEPPEDAQLGADGDGAAEPHGELHRHAPDVVGVGDHDGPADGLVQDGRGDAAVEEPRVALMLASRCEQREEVAVVELVEARGQAARVLEAADEASSRVVLLPLHADPHPFPPASRPTSRLWQHSGRLFKSWHRAAARADREYGESSN
jgi:hypothetical protein